MRFTPDILDKARAAQEEWRDAGLGHRLMWLGLIRHRLAENARALAESCGRRNIAESLSAEMLPLIDAVRFLERRGEKVLGPRRERRGRPFWLKGVSLEIHREPRGVVLVIGPGNYPLFLPGVQVLQALVAGNAVIVKPALSGAKAMEKLASVLDLSDGLFSVLNPDPDEANGAIRAGVDHVVLTGSAGTGRAVLAETSQRLIPATMELSGCDAAFILESADVKLAAKAVAWGLQLNHGCTCIAPRRQFVASSLFEEFKRELGGRLGDAPAIEAGSACDQPSPQAAECIRNLLREPSVELVSGGVGDAGIKPTVVAGLPPTHPVAKADLFAPVAFLFPFDHPDEALEAAKESPYRLGASIFGAPADARAIAGFIDAGTVVINDMIVPTADPRAPFGGRGESGFGTTRGAEGLLEMTRPKAILARRGKFLPHLDGARPEDAPVFENYIAAVHGRGHAARLSAWRRLVQSLREKLRRDRASPS